MCLHGQQQDLNVATHVHSTIDSQPRVAGEDGDMRCAEEPEVLANLARTGFLVSALHSHGLVQLEPALATSIEIFVGVFVGKWKVAAARLPCIVGA
ncbi:hypothetical protein ASF45_24970 [Pseudorhodoferax sp. Leaf265]|nr:hypothetical protein ASF45_24970 [Pseudorhodoferax sp. Leaf265]